MGKILEFSSPKSELLPLSEAIEKALRPYGIPSAKVMELCAYARYLESNWHLPAINLSIPLPADIDDEQFVQVERAVRKAFGDVGRQFYEAKNALLLTLVADRFGKMLGADSTE